MLRFYLLEQQDLDQKAVAPEMLESFSVVGTAVLAIFTPRPDFQNSCQIQRLYFFFSNYQRLAVPSSSFQSPFLIPLRAVNSA